MVSVQVPAKALKRAIDNISTLTRWNENAEIKDVLPSVLFTITPSENGEAGRLSICGACTHILAVEEVPHISMDEFNPVEIPVLFRSPSKEAVVDCLDKIAWSPKARTEFGGTSIKFNKDDTIQVDIEPGILLRLSQGEELIAELEAVDVDIQTFRNIVKSIDEIPIRELTGPIMLNAGTLARLGRLKIQQGVKEQTPNIDIAGLEGFEGKVIAFRCGEEISGLISLVNREWFGRDNEFSDSFGSRKMLIDRKR